MTRPPAIFYFTCEAEEKEDLPGVRGRGGKTAWERRGKLGGGRGRSAEEENDVSHHHGMQRRKEEDGCEGGGISEKSAEPNQCGQIGVRISFSTSGKEGLHRRGGGEKI